MLNSSRAPDFFAPLCMCSFDPQPATTLGGTIGKLARDVWDNEHFCDEPELRFGYIIL